MNSITVSAAARVFACDTSEPVPFTTKSQVRKHMARCHGGTKIVTGSDCKLIETILQGLKKGASCGQNASCK